MIRTYQLDEHEFKRRNRRAFIALGSGLVIALGAFIYLQTTSPAIALSWPLRRTLEINGALGEKLASSSRVDLAQFQRPVKKNARENGDVGLSSPIDLEHWRLHVETEGETQTEPNSLLSMNDLRALPKSTEAVQFKCVEGWSEVMSFSGVRFSDFLRAEHLGTKGGRDVDPAHPENFYKYVGFETPDGEYYVSIDMKSLLVPTALLAYEQNDQPLTLAHGAPLRLYIPNKYGIKSIKRIGRITFSDERPPDYWYDEGYDWFAGL